MSTPASTAEDELTELYDADFSRLDLVGKGANGMPILIAKQTAGGAGLLSAAHVRSLIQKGTPVAKRTHPYVYESRGVRVTSQRALTVGEVQAAAREYIRKAKKGAPIPVYTADGTLVGTTDRDNIQPLGAPPLTAQEQAAADAQAAEAAQKTKNQIDDLHPAPADSVGASADGTTNADAVTKGVRLSAADIVNVMRGDHAPRTRPERDVALAVIAEVFKSTGDLSAEGAAATGIVAMRRAGEAVLRVRRGEHPTRIARRTDGIF